METPIVIWSAVSKILEHKFVFDSRDIIWLFASQFLMIWLQSYHLVNCIYLLLYLIA